MTQRKNILSDTSDTKVGKLINVSEEQQIYIFVKQMLAKRIFIGHYQERRYVGPLNSYRDIVCVSHTEDDLPRDLLIVKKRLQQFYPVDLWTGITGPDMTGAPVGVCLWVKLNNIPFGHYWFQIREVKFVENMEIYVRLKCLRSVSSEGLANNSIVEKSSSLESSEDKTPTKQKEPDVNPAIDIQDIIFNIKNIHYREVVMNWLTKLSLLLTLYNLQQVMTFLLVVLATAITGFFKFIAYLGDFSLKMMREISVFIHTCTPLFLGIIDFFSKCFGGILILITLMWKGSVPKNVYQQQPYKPPLPPVPGNPSRSSYPMYRQNNQYSRPL